MKPHRAPHKITTPFRRRGRLWSLGWHTGDDWNTPRGTTAYAMADGRVYAVSRNSSYGLNIIIESVVRGTTYRWSVNHLATVRVRTGQRVSIGQPIATTGDSGNTTGPHDHVEVRRAPFTFHASTMVDPQILYDVAAPTSRPAWATAKPDAKPARRWFRTMTWNLGGMNDAGRASWSRRAPELVHTIAGWGPDVLAVQELPNNRVDSFTARLAHHGYARVSGSDGRYLFIKTATTTALDGGVFDLQPRHAGDDKQAAWARLHVRGGTTVVTSGHLEADAGADTVRVEQAAHLIDQAEAVAWAAGLGRQHIVHNVDTNSDTWVRERAFNEAGYVDALETAHRAVGGLLASFTGWVKRRATAKTGARIDGIFSHRSRPLIAAYQVSSAAGLADHLPTVADVALRD